MPLRAMMKVSRYLADLGWASGEYASQVMLDPVLRRIAPRAEVAQGVLTLDGLEGGEASLSTLNAFLAAQGFRVEAWGGALGRPPRDAAILPEALRRLIVKIDELAGETGRPVAIVARGVGAAYAAAIAREQGDKVDRLVLFGDGGRRGVEAMSASAAPHAPRVIFASGLAEGRFPLLTPARSEMDEQKGGPLVETIVVAGSRLGLAVNPVVLVGVCDRLLEPVEAWAPFDAMQYGMGFEGGDRRGAAAARHDPWRRCKAKT